MQGVLEMNCPSGKHANTGSPKLCLGEKEKFLVQNSQEENLS